MEGVGKLLQSLRNSRSRKRSAEIQIEPFNYDPGLTSHKKERQTEGTFMDIIIPGESTTHVVKEMEIFQNGLTNVGAPYQKDANEEVDEGSMNVGAPYQRDADEKVDEISNSSDASHLLHSDSDSSSKKIERRSEESEMYTVFNVESEVQKENECRTEESEMNIAFIAESMVQKENGMEQIQNDDPEWNIFDSDDDDASEVIMYEILPSAVSENFKLIHSDHSSPIYESDFLLPKGLIQQRCAKVNGECEIVENGTVETETFDSNVGAVDDIEGNQTSQNPRKHLVEIQTEHFSDDSDLTSHKKERQTEGTSMDIITPDESVIHIINEKETFKNELMNVGASHQKNALDLIANCYSSETDEGADEMSLHSDSDDHGTVNLDSDDDNGSVVIISETLPTVVSSGFHLIRSEESFMVSDKDFLTDKGILKQMGEKMNVTARILKNGDINMETMESNVGAFAVNEDLQFNVDCNFMQLNDGEYVEHNAEEARCGSNLMEAFERQQLLQLSQELKEIEKMRIDAKKAQTNRQQKVSIVRQIASDAQLAFMDIKKRSRGILQPNVDEILRLAFAAEEAKERKQSVEEETTKADIKTGEILETEVRRMWLAHGRTMEHMAKQYRKDIQELPLPATLSMADDASTERNEMQSNVGAGAGIEKAYVISDGNPECCVNGEQINRREPHEEPKQRHMRAKHEAEVVKSSIGVEFERRQLQVIAETLKEVEERRKKAGIDRISRHRALGIVRRNASDSNRAYWDIRKRSQGILGPNVDEILRLCFAAKEAEKRKCALLEETTKADLTAEDALEADIRRLWLAYGRKMEYMAKQHEKEIQAINLQVALMVCGDDQIATMVYEED